jgi:HrpA-like RNA helicase
MAPTLFRKGALNPIKSLIKGVDQNIIDDEKKKLDEFVPIHYVINIISEKLKISKPKPMDRVLILQSGTGSGKSTAFPSELYKTYKDTVNKLIICLQPRTLTAVDIPIELSKEPAYASLWEFGVNIGYQTGELQKKPQKKGLVYATVGILYNQMLVMTDEEIMKKYSFILVDECHERSVDLDMTLYLLKSFIYRNYQNPECPMVVCMSATFDVFVYHSYFSTEPGKKPEIMDYSTKTDEIIIVKGETFPIEEHFLNFTSANYIEDVCNKVVELHNKLKFEAESNTVEKLVENGEKSKFVDFLIFVTGAGQMKKIKKFLDKLNAEGEMIIIPMDSARNKENGIDLYNLKTDINKLRVTLRNGREVKPIRKIIISTNIAETGLTIPTLLAVFDLMMSIASEHNPIYNTALLISKPTTQSMSRQRRGRAGRKAPGIYYPMCSKETWDSMIINQHPEIITSDFTLHLLKIIVKYYAEFVKSTFKNEDDNVLLNKILIKTDEERIEETNKLLDAGYKFDVTTLDLLDNPSADSYCSAVEKLFKLHFIDNNMIPTPMGIIANRCRKLTIENIRMIFAGYEENVNIMDLITIAAFATVSKAMDWNNPASLEFQGNKDNFMALDEDDIISSVTTEEIPFDLSEEIPSNESLEGKVGGSLHEIKDDSNDNITKLIMDAWYDEGLIGGGYDSEFVNPIGGGFEKRSHKKFNNKNEKPNHNSKPKPMETFGFDDKTNLLNKIVIGCDFTECLFILNKFYDVVKNDIKNVENWCNENGFNYSKLLTVIKVRDEIIESLCANHLNIHYNKYNLFAESNLTPERLDYIQRIKNCVKIGYCYYTASWDNEKSMYIDDQKHVPINVISKLVKVPRNLKPKKITFSGRIVSLDNMQPENPYRFSTTDLITI